MWVAAGVVAEKSSRVMELLISAASPAELVTGKVIGIGLAGFVQYVAILRAGARRRCCCRTGSPSRLLGSSSGLDVSLGALSPGPPRRLRLVLDPRVRALRADLRRRGLAREPRRGPAGARPAVEPHRDRRLHPGGHGADRRDRPARPVRVVRAVLEPVRDAHAADRGPRGAVGARRCRSACSSRRSRSSASSPSGCTRPACSCTASAPAPAPSSARSSARPRNSASPTGSRIATTRPVELERAAGGSAQGRAPAGRQVAGDRRARASSRQVCDRARAASARPARARPRRRSATSGCARPGRYGLARWRARIPKRPCAETASNSARPSAAMPGTATTSSPGRRTWRRSMAALVEGEIQEGPAVEVEEVEREVGQRPPGSPASRRASSSWSSRPDSSTTTISPSRTADRACTRAAEAGELDRRRAGGAVLGDQDYVTGALDLGRTDERERAGAAPHRLEQVRVGVERLGKGTGEHRSQARRQPRQRRVQPHRQLVGHAGRWYAARSGGPAWRPVYPHRPMAVRQPDSISRERASELVERGPAGAPGRSGACSGG